MSRTRASGVTDGLGGFSIPAVVPASGCNRASCTFYAGPLAPLNFSVAGSIPAGYFVTSSVDGPAVTVSYVYALSTVALDPPGRATLSTDAPTVIRATPEAGDGSPSPASVSYDWHLTGYGWNVVSGIGSPNLTIKASIADPGALALWVNGTFNGTAESAPAADLILDAVATSATDGSVRPTSLDVGVAARFDLVGSGAIGYPYSAQIFVGVGTRSVLAPCVENGTNGGTEFVDCTTSVVYNSTGVVQPSAVLTNGYSFASWTFPSLTVAPSPAFSVSPSPVVAYVGTPTTVTVDVAGSTGTPPLGPACLSSGNGREFCDTGPGPAYPFQVEWGSAGSYNAGVTVADGTGANVSVAVPVEIYSMMNATWISSGALNPGSLGGSYGLTASVRGGALPLSYWWNTTGGTTLMEGTVGTDGTMYYWYAPAALGWANVSLELVDRLGTREAVEFPALIVPGDAAEVELVRGGGDGTVAAGEPYELEWVASDGPGVTTPSYQAQELLTVTSVGSGPARGAWVNGSAGPAPAGPNGTFMIAPNDWSLGHLFLNVTVAGDGSFGLSLSGELPVLPESPGTTLEVIPNVHLLKLWDPTQVVGDPRGTAALYRITDAFDDNITGGFLVTRESFGSLSSSNVTAVRSGPGRFHGLGQLHRALRVRRDRERQLRGGCGAAADGGRARRGPPVPVVGGAGARRDGRGAMARSDGDRAPPAPWRLGRRAEARRTVAGDRGGAPSALRGPGPRPRPRRPRSGEDPRRAFGSVPRTTADPRGGHGVGRVPGGGGGPDGRSGGRRTQPVPPRGPSPSGSAGGARRPSPRRGAPASDRGGDRARFRVRGSGGPGPPRPLGVPAHQIVVPVRGLAGAEAGTCTVVKSDFSSAAPLATWAVVRPLWRRSSMSSAIRSISFSRIPSRVTSGVPIRTPCGCFGLLSPGRRFLLAMMPASANRRAASSPPPSRVTRTAMVWEAVNPSFSPRTSNPRAWSAAPRARAFAIT